MLTGPRIISSPMLPACASATPRITASRPAPRCWSATGRSSPRSMSWAARPARARPSCWRPTSWSKASMRCSSRAARPSASMPAPASWTGCARSGAAFASGRRRCRSCRGAILFDLLNGGDKDWAENPYRALGRARLRRRRRRISRSARPAPASARRPPTSRAGSARPRWCSTTAHRRRAGRRQPDRQRHCRRPAAFLGRAVRDRTTSSAAAGPCRARCAFADTAAPSATASGARQHHHRHRRDRRAAEQGAAEAAGGRRAGRHGARHQPVAHARRRRPGLCRFDRRPAARRSDPRCHRARPRRRGLPRRAIARAIYLATPAPGDPLPTWREKWGRG